MSQLQTLASINLEGLQDLDTMRAATQTLAQEISSRSETLAAAIQAVAQLTAGVRDGAVELDWRTTRIADAQSEEQQAILDLRRRLEILEGHKVTKDDVDPRIEALESLMEKLLGNLQDQSSGSRENHTTTAVADALQQTMHQHGAGLRCWSRHPPARYVANLSVRELPITIASRFTATLVKG